MRKLRTEEEIIANWRGDLEAPVVSICCIAFNHELYIEDALEGFLIQETDFPFEILIHDDSSTDRTAEIIHEYEKKYPRLIKPIYQIENQYSKGIKVNSVYNFSRAKGEYIALCEGDDYWVDKDKIYAQIKLMTQYPDINISFHPAYQVDGFVLNKDKVLCNYGGEVKIYSPEEVILGGGGFMPTASLMVKTNILQNLPEWFFKYAPVGDMYMQALSSAEKGALFIPIKSSIYRVNVPGSWSSQQRVVTAFRIKQDTESHEKCFLALSSQYSNLPKQVFDSAIAREFSLGSLSALMGSNYKLSKELLNKSISYRSGGNKIQKALVIFRVAPFVLKYLIKIKWKFFL